MQIVFSDVTIPRRPERIKVHLATRDGFERPPEARVGGGKKRIDTVETAEKRACIRGFAHRKELTYFAAVDRMAARDSHSADGKTRQLPPRHQFERRLRLLPPNRAERGHQTDQITQRARENHQPTPARTVVLLDDLHSTSA